MRVTFVITNDRHHHHMMLPVAQRLAGRHELRLLSFAEFRGLDTPAADWRALGATVTRAPPYNFRARASAATVDTVAGVGSPGQGIGRWVRDAVWRTLLRPWLRLGRPDLVVLPNDTAYPGDRLVSLLNRRGIPFVLVQEGIRFPLPGEGATAYGTRGAAAVACWGSADVEDFAARGVPRATLRSTGNPRYDAILARDSAGEANRMRHRGELPARYLLFASNPIDDQGFCSTDEKYASFRRFVARALPVLDAHGLQLALKRHGREPAEGYRAALGDLADRVVFLEGGDIHATLAGAEAVVVWASTVGLEGLLQHRPLAVWETPGHGFVFDYVARGAALGLADRPDFEDTLAALLERGVVAGTDAYVQSRLDHQGTSADAVTALVEDVLRAA